MQAIKWILINRKKLPSVPFHTVKQAAAELRCVPQVSLFVPITNSNKAHMSTKSFTVD
jgi:hypothetical protein